MPSYSTHRTTYPDKLSGKPTPSDPPYCLEPKTISKGTFTASAALARMVKSAEVKTNAAIEALGLDFSQYTNAELDTVETAARAERRRRWLATMGDHHGDETTKA